MQLNFSKIMTFSIKNYDIIQSSWKSKKDAPISLLHKSNIYEYMKCSRNIKKRRIKSAFENLFCRSLKSSDKNSIWLAVPSQNGDSTPRLWFTSSRDNIRWHRCGKVPTTILCKLQTSSSVSIVWSPSGSNSPNWNC